jgi:hypothetical protein
VRQFRIEKSGACCGRSCTERRRWTFRLGVHGAVHKHQILIRQDRVQTPLKKRADAARAAGPVSDPSCQSRGHDGPSAGWRSTADVQAPGLTSTVELCSIGDCIDKHYGGAWGSTTAVLTMPVVIEVPERKRSGRMPLCRRGARSLGTRLRICER